MGNINCIITKDLGRLGREHIVMGYYLEFVFPEIKVRYVAANNNEDNDKRLSGFVPLKNQFNMFIAKDTSRKVENSFWVKFKNVERIGAYAPIGYKKYPKIKNELIIDKETLPDHRVHF